MAKIFIYKARDKSGNLVRGTLEAESKSDLVDKLQKKSYFVISLKVKGRFPISLESQLERFTPVSSTEKLTFYIQFANLINSGLPILTALKILSNQISNSRLKTVLDNVCREIESGASLSDCLENQGGFFPALLVHMVRAGETSGSLANVLTRFVQFAEEDFDLRQKVNSALFYPAILTFASAALIVFITSFVVPNFVKIFTKANVALPLPTRILNSIGVTLRDNGILFLITIFILSFVLKYLINSDKGRFYFDKFKLSLPLVGSIVLRLSISRFSRTLATMDSSGVPILKSLEISKEVMGNKVIAKKVEVSCKMVEEGSTLAEALRKTNQFPEDTLQMISAGEQSGNLSGMLLKLSDYYDKLIDYQLKRLVSIIEPLFLVIIGCIVAFIMTSMLLPVFDMVKVIRSLK